MPRQETTGAACDTRSDESAASPQIGKGSNQVLVVRVVFPSYRVGASKKTCSICSRCSHIDNILIFLGVFPETPEHEGLSDMFHMFQGGGQRP